MSISGQSTRTAETGVAPIDAFGRHYWLAIVLAALLVAGIVAAFAPSPPRVSDHFGEIALTPARDSLSPPSDAADWRVDALPGPSQIGRAFWLRAPFLLDGRQGSAALSLGGVFSARAWINGVPIGAKGAPAIAAEDEIPGPIDTLIPLGDDVRVGENELLLFVSSHHSRLSPGALVHTLAITPAGIRSGQPIGCYTIAISQIGALAAFAGLFVFAAARRSARRADLWAAIGAGCLLLALTAETARVWINYAYPMHAPRLALVWGALFVFGCCVLLADAANAKTKPPRRIILLSAPVALATYFAFESFDDRARAALAILFTANILQAAPRAVSDRSVRALIGVLVVSIALILLKPDQFIDNGVYAMGALTLAVFLAKVVQPTAQLDLRRSSVVREEAHVVDRAFDSGARPLTSGFAVVKAAGNYVEIIDADGRRAFERRRLSEFAVEPTGTAMRVHRSYVVNLRFARRLIAKTGSRYVLELLSGAKIPVSRRLADQVRKRLEAAANGADASA